MAIKAMNTMVLDNTYVITLPYGVCGTAAATAAKVVTIDNFSLETGVKIAVKFTYANTAGTPTLNVNSTGAKNIVAYGTTSAGANKWQAGAVVEMTYDGTSWVMDAGTLATTTYYGMTKLNSATNSTSTSEAATPSAVKSAYDLANTANTAATNAASAASTAQTTANSANTAATNAATAASNAQTTANSKASTTLYSATIGTSWTGSAAPYTQTITVSGMLATDTPIVDVNLSSTAYADKDAVVEAYAKVYRITTAANSITVYADEKTTVSIPIQLKVVR